VSWLPLADSHVRRSLRSAVCGWACSYLITQIPAGILATRVGGKIVLTSNMAATAVLTLLIPAVARRGGAMPLAALLSTMGLFQGSLVPAASLMEKNWLPTGTCIETHYCSFSTMCCDCHWLV
jgi:ACS family sodium-dependent inorganic phosphate cotransporter